MIYFIAIIIYYIKIWVYFFKFFSRYLKESGAIRIKKSSSTRKSPPPKSFIIENIVTWRPKSNDFWRIFLEDAVFVAYRPIFLSKKNEVTQKGIRAV